jgi:putative ABC transport system permease protein
VGPRSRVAYRWISGLLPRAFRAGAGRELEDAAMACLARERARRGRLGLVLGWLAIVADTARSAVALRRPRRADRRLSQGVTMRQLVRDARHAARGLRRQPGFTAVAMLTLALGLGANTAVFTVIRSVLWRPLPYPASDRLVFISSEFGDQGLTRFPVSVPEFVELRDRTRALASVGAYYVGDVNLGGDAPSRPARALVSPGLLATLGVAPAMGRAFTAEDARPGAPPVALLSWSAWQQTLGGDPGVLGREIRINDLPTEIVGVMPEGFDLRDDGVGLLEPLTVDPASFPSSRAEHYLYLIGRLAPGVTLAGARDDLDNLVATWADLAPGAHTPSPTHHRLTMVALRRDVVGGAARVLWLLQGAVWLVLLVACANFAGLLLVRADSRLREFAIRSALGASGGRLFAQALVESTLLCSLGAAAGLGLAFVGLPLLLATFPIDVPRATEISVDGGVLAATVAVALVASLVVSAVPFARARTASLNQVATRTHTGARATLRSSLVVVETAIAVTLVVVAGLLLRTTWNLIAVDPGFDSADLTTFSVVLPGSTYPAGARLRFHEALRERLGALPGVAAVATMSGLPPLRNPNVTDTDFEHIPNDRPHGEPPIENVDFYQMVSANYVDTMGMTLERGRGFQPSDTSGAPVVLVNEALAERFFRDRPAVGARVRPPWGGRMPWFTIVGVLKDVTQAGLDEPPGTELYFLADQVTRLAGMTASQVHVVMRTGRSTASIAPDARAIVRDLDPALPVIGLRSMTDVFEGTIARPRFVAFVLSLFGLVALALASIGTYGALAFVVADRAREFGIRLTLGADRGGVLRLVLGRGARILTAGLVTGLATSLVASRLAGRFLFGVAPADALTLGLVSLVVMGAGLTACVLPAWRAARVDPLLVLRGE